MTPEQKTKNPPVMWFAARTRHAQEISIREKLRKIGVECFVPCKLVRHEKHGRPYMAETPMISSLVFIHTDKRKALDVANCYLPIFYIIDRRNNSALVVPDKQMEDFRRVIGYDSNAILPEQIAIRPGNKVRIMKGPLAGVEGDVINYAGKTSVVVTLSEGLLQAKVEVGLEDLERIP